MSSAPKATQRTPFKRWCDENTGLFFLIPWILGFLIFKAYPFASSLVYSFTDLNFFRAPEAGLCAVHRLHPEL